MQHALEALHKDARAMGTATLGWNAVRDEAMRYVEHKKAGHRFDEKADFEQAGADVLG